MRIYLLLSEMRRIFSILPRVFFLNFRILPVVLHEMRGGSFEMSTTCVQGIRPLGGYQPNIIMEPSSPASAWQFHSTIPVSTFCLLFY